MSFFSLYKVDAIGHDPSFRIAIDSICHSIHAILDANLSYTVVSYSSSMFVKAYI